MTHQEALKKLMKYCAYQDRCQKEVRNKLYEIGAPHEAIEHIITDLIADNFLNEERFATSFARGKFYFKQWGICKIKQELNSREISSYCIKKGLKEIDPHDYRETIRKLIHKKAAQFNLEYTAQNKNKIHVYLYNKGYESELIWEELKNITEETN